MDRLEKRVAELEKELERIKIKMREYSSISCMYKSLDNQKYLIERELKELRRVAGVDMGEDSYLEVAAKFRPAVEADDEEIVNPVLRSHIGFDMEEM